MCGRRRRPLGTDTVVALVTAALVTATVLLSVGYLLGR